MMSEFRFESCTRNLDEQTVEGRSCFPVEGELYHHTEARNLSKIRETGELRPDPSPFADGTVNFSANPNWHRFGSLRFVLHRDRVSTTPMCYTSGEEERKRSRAVDRRQEELFRRGITFSKDRIENSEMGAESWGAFKNECKHISREPVKLKGKVKRLEYWIPHNPSITGGNIVGTNVFPCEASWSMWATGRPPEANVEQVRDEIADAKNYAQELGVPFRVRSCYPFIVMSPHQIARLNEDNLSRLEEGRELSTESVYPLPEAECTCPPETVPEPCEGEECKR